MTNRELFEEVLHLSDRDIDAEHRKYCRENGHTTSCSACKLRQKMCADPNSVGKTCFTYWLSLEVSEVPRNPNQAPSSPNSEPTKSKSVMNNETSFTMLDE